MSANASRRKRGRRTGSASIHEPNSPESNTMPSVEPAERANETETAVWGDVATSAMTHSESALSGAGRRRAKQADMPANAMHAARTAETGAAANTR